MIGLENETDLASAQQRHAVLVETGDVLAIQNDFSGRWGVEAGEKAQQCALAAARGSHNGNEFAVLDVKINATQNVDAMRGGLNSFGESRHPDGRHSDGTFLQFFIMALGEDHLSWMCSGSDCYDAIGLRKFQERCSGGES
jgi:hypothetical protein